MKRFEMAIERNPEITLESLILHCPDVFLRLETDAMECEKNPQESGGGLEQCRVCWEVEED